MTNVQQKQKRNIARHGEPRPSSHATHTRLPTSEEAAAAAVASAVNATASPPAKARSLGDNGGGGGDGGGGRGGSDGSDSSRSDAVNATASERQALTGHGHTSSVSTGTDALGGGDGASHHVVA